MSEEVTVYVVDDEQPVLEGVKRVLEDNGNPYRLAGSALNGSKALEQIPVIQPDIILMDINMPGINGLEVIRQLNSAGVQAVSILITAYERFDIAREAFGLGIYSYLLKPVTPQKLIAALDEARPEVDGRKSRHRSLLQAREDLLESRKLMEWSFVNQLTQGILSHPMIEEFMERLGISPDTKFVPVLLIFQEHSSRNAHDLIVQLGYQLPLVSGSLIHQRQLWTLIRGEHSVASVKNALTKAGNRLSSPVPPPAPVPLASSAPLASSGRPEPQDAGSGILCNVYPAALLSDIPAVIADTASSSGFNLGSRTDVDESEARSRQLQTQGCSGSELAVALERLLIRGGIYEARDLLFSDPCFRSSAEDPGGRSGDLATAYLFVQRILALLYSREEAEVTDSWLSSGPALVPRDMSGLDKGVVEEFQRLARVYSRKMDSNPLIRQVLLYIDENFHRQFSLEEAAQYCNVSPQHLSRSFSAHMGISFVDYLTQMRVQEGIRLMQQGKQNISEVARLCGYSDPNYFSRIFKKVHGITPTAFIQSLQGESQ